MFGAGEFRLCRRLPVHNTNVVILLCVPVVLDMLVQTDAELEQKSFRYLSYAVRRDVLQKMCCKSICRAVGSGLPRDSRISV